MQDGSERIHYLDPSIPTYISLGNLHTFPGMAALCHWHEDVELLLALDGHLAYSVNEYLGRTPNDSRNSFRPEKGMELLKEAAMPTTENADACGFGSSSYFAELFTRHKGLSPTACRKRL